MMACPPPAMFGAVPNISGCPGSLPRSLFAPQIVQSAGICYHVPQGKGDALTAPLIVEQISSQKSGSAKIPYEKEGMSVTEPSLATQEQHVEEVKLAQIVPFENMLEIPSVLRNPKNVEVPEIEDVQVTSVVEVPKIDFVPRVVEVPYVQIQEIIKQIPKQCGMEEIVEVAEIPEAHHQKIVKPTSKTVLDEVLEVVGTPPIAHMPKNVEVPEVNVQDIIKHVLKPATQQAEEMIEALQRPAAAKKIIESARVQLRELSQEIKRLQV